MFFPRFSTRRLFYITAGCGLTFAIVSAAVRGQQWALALTMAVLGMVMLFVVYNLMFLVASLFASIRPAARQKGEALAPFATLRPPPQLVRPEDPED